MLALTLVDSPCPTAIGLKSWWTFFGMIATPAAIRLRISSASIPSTAATYRISPVIRPRLACSICVMEVAPHPGRGASSRARSDNARALVRGGGRPHFSDDRHLDLARVLHPRLDLLRQVGGQEGQLVVGHLVGPRDHPDLPPRL